MKDAYYFTHDANARNDMKIQTMMGDYGTRGYGMYWICVELLREESDYRLSRDFNAISKVYAHQMHTTPQCAKKFIEDCIEKYKLFKSNKLYFWSESLLRRMKRWDEIAEQRRLAGMRGGVASAKAKKQAIVNEEKKRKEKRVKSDEYVSVETIYFELFEKKTGLKPDYPYPKNRAILKPLIIQYGAPFLKKLMPLWFTNEFGERCGYVLGGFKSCINELITQVARASPEMHRCPKCGSQLYTQNADGTWSCQSCYGLGKNKSGGKR